MTNEQRAHDIAVALLPTFIETEKEKVQLNASEYQEQSEFHIDVFKIYMKTYTATLNSLNKEFPDCE